MFSLGEGVSGGSKYVTQELQPSLSMLSSTLTATTRNKDFAHGCLIATLLDQTLGTTIFVQWAPGCATAELTVKYERALPIPGVVLCRSWVERTEGVLEDGKGTVFARG